MSDSPRQGAAGEPQQETREERGRRLNRARVQRHRDKNKVEQLRLDAELESRRIAAGAGIQHNHAMMSRLTSPLPPGETYFDQAESLTSPPMSSPHQQTWGSPGPPLVNHHQHGNDYSQDEYGNYYNYDMYGNVSYRNPPPISSPHGSSSFYGSQAAPSSEGNVQQLAVVATFGPPAAASRHGNYTFPPRATNHLHSPQYAASPHGSRPLAVNHSPHPPRAAAACALYTNDNHAEGPAGNADRHASGFTGNNDAHDHAAGFTRRDSGGNTAAASIATTAHSTRTGASPVANLPAAVRSNNKVEQQGTIAKTSASSKKRSAVSTSDEGEQLEPPTKKPRIRTQKVTSIAPAHLPTAASPSGAPTSSGSRGLATLTFAAERLVVEKSGRTLAAGATEAFAIDVVAAQNAGGTGPGRTNDNAVVASGLSAENGEIMEEVSGSPSLASEPMEEVEEDDDDDDLMEADSLDDEKPPNGVLPPATPPRSGARGHGEIADVSAAANPSPAGGSKIDLQQYIPGQQHMAPPNAIALRRRGNGQFPQDGGMVANPYASPGAPFSPGHVQNAAMTPSRGGAVPPYRSLPRMPSQYFDEIRRSHPDYDKDTALQLAAMESQAELD